MRIYSAADIHGTQYRLNLILNHVDEYSPDIVVICGDITQFGPSEVAINLLNQIPVEIVAVRGNCDPLEVNQGIDESKAENLRLKSINKKGINFVGWDPVGGVHNPIMNDEAMMFLKSTVNKDSVLVSHIPPYGLQDTIFLGKHGGNKEILEIIKINKPKLVLCGHIHENPGFTKYEDSIIVNCSMGKRTEGAIIDLTDSINVKILE